MTWICIETYYPERDFDKEKWTENVEKRYEYADYLVDNKKINWLDQERNKGNSRET